MAKVSGLICKPLPPAKFYIAPVPNFQDFRAALPLQLNDTAGVEGLVWAGSSAEPERADAWSDHDFFVIVKPGLQERFRQDLRWLPWPEEIAWKARETEHGLKVVYRDGFVLEFAVFDSTELRVAKLNHHAVALGDAELREIVQSIYQPKSPADSRTLDDHLGLTYALLLIGSGRYARGERLVGGQFIRSYAVSHLLQAARLSLTSATPNSRDVLDPWRRFESEYPEFAADLDAACSLPANRAAQEIAALGVKWFGQSSAVPNQAFEVLRQRLGW